MIRTAAQQMTENDRTAALAVLNRNGVKMDDSATNTEILDALVEVYQRSDYKA